MLSSKAIMRMRNMPQLQALAGVRIASRQFSSVRIPHRPQFAPTTRNTSLAALRFSSTLPTPTTTFPSPTNTLPTPTAVAGAEQAGTIPAHTSTLPDYIPTAESLTPNLTAPEHIGYLQSLGLDYGWGPTTCIQYLLEHIHVWSDTPWWASIMLTVAFIRVAQFPFYLRMSDTTARMKELNPQVVALTKKMREAQARGDTVAMVMGRQKVSALYKAAGVNRLWIGFPITQLPLFYGFYKNLYGMAELKVPGLVEGGKWWFHDLTVCDPYYILPLVSSLSMGLQIYLGGDAGASMQTRRMKQGMVLILPLFSFLFVNSWPAALTLYFFTNSVLGLAQALALRNVWLREKLGLYPLNPTTPNPLAQGPKEGLNALNIATKPGKVIDVVGTVPAQKEKKQIGGKGGFLDKITGGSVRKDGKKKTITDYILGEKVKGEEGGIGQMLNDNSEMSIHKKYEEKRERQIKKELAAQEEKRRKILKL
ncbi:uncharacterized protein H6S33_003869 [Morchella sextelata]|uniref:uncharacterized protein n=1 Tax=Morchella sextelata TaxID=1174677 RepID=UPI001D05C1DF|nr:uncharacterized protein H6S33_003869 [Morchella sextelata]KAH0606208.1 hypothetical protein H6S33_003869 [Morchella sextelata]